MKSCNLERWIPYPSESEEDPPKMTGYNLVRMNEENDKHTLARLRATVPKPGQEHPAFEVRYRSVGIEDNGYGPLAWPLELGKLPIHYYKVIYGGGDQFWKLERNVDYEEPFQVEPDESFDEECSPMNLLLETL